MANPTCSNQAPFTIELNGEKSRPECINETCLHQSEIKESSTAPIDSRYHSTQDLIKLSEQATDTSKRKQVELKGIVAILKHAMRGGSRSFLFMYFARAGVASIIKLIPVLKKKIHFIQALEPFGRKETFRFAAVFGSFCFIWRSLYNTLVWKREKQDHLNGLIAGSLASLSILIETRENRMAMSQQFFIRGMQALYNAMKARSYIHLPLGDSFMFIFSCASIMYGYIMQPDTLPREYYSWMIKTARVPHSILQINRHHVRSLESNSTQSLSDAVYRDTLGALAEQHGGSAALVLNAADALAATNEGILPCVPCQLLHPSIPHCRYHAISLMLKVVRDMIPVYLSLNIVPMVLFRGKKFVKEPLMSLLRAIQSTARSSVFLGVFVTSYMTCICFIRHLIQSKQQGSLPLFLSHFIPSQDAKLFYYLSGLISGSSIFIEQKSRRSELAMYVLPKAIQSLFLVFERRGALCKIPGFDVMLSMMAMGSLMSFYHTEPQVISPLLYKFMTKVLGKH